MGTHRKPTGLPTRIRYTPVTPPASNGHPSSAVAITLDTLHLAAADRLPQPLVMLAFDRRQADAACAMGTVVEGA